MAIVSTAVLGGAIASVPASAWDVISDTGTAGAYEIVDEQADSWGANCVYETGSKDLDKISIRGPKNVHGTSVSRQWIGYRYIIQRNSPPTDDLVYSTIYKSPILYAQADDNENPKSWSRRTWTAPESTSGDYRVRVVMLWYTKSSHAATALKDKVIIQYEWYRQIWSDTWDTDKDYCSADYS